MDEAGPGKGALIGGLVNQSGFRQTWDTADVRTQERFSYFRDTMCQTYLACTPEVQSNEEISARIEMVALNQGTAGRATASLGRLTRTQADVNRMSDEYISLRLSTAGQHHTQFEKTSIILKTGDVFLVDSKTCFDCHSSLGFASLVGVTLRKSELRNIVGSDILFDGIIANPRPLSVALFNCLDTLDNRLSVGSRDELSALYDACQSIVAALFARDQDLLESASAASTSISQGLVASIKSFADSNLGNPDLSPPVVAHKFGVSVRYVHKLFDGTDETFSNYVLNRRLERVRVELMTSLKSDKSLEEIAHLWGFREMTTFHRNFKRRYDMTPNQMRYASIGR